MATQTTKSLKEQIASLKPAGIPKPVSKPPPENQKINSGKELNPPPKEDGRKHNKGVPGAAGRKPGGTAMQRRLLKQAMQEHFEEEVNVKVKDPKTGKEKVIKKPRVLVVLQTLFQIGVESKNEHALDKWLNRAVGKAPQPLIGDEEEDPIRVDLGIDRILKKAYGNNTDDEGEE